MTATGICFKTVPHKDLEDMAVVYRFIADVGINEHGTILVTDRMLERGGTYATVHPSETQ